MPNSLISTALAGGLILAMFGTVLVVAKKGRPRVASALLGAGLIMWAAGLYFCPPMARIIALGLFALFVLSFALSAPLKPRQRKVKRASLVIWIFIVSTGPLFKFGLDRLFVVAQSRALASMSLWLAATSLIVIAVALAMALIQMRIGTQTILSSASRIKSNGS